MCLEYINAMLSNNDAHVGLEYEWWITWPFLNVEKMYLNNEHNGRFSIAQTSVVYDLYDV